MKDAYLDGLIQRDVYSRLKANGSSAIKSDNFLSVSDFEKLRGYLYAHLDDIATTPFLLMALIALETGARSGEIQGLTINDVHPTHISINKSYSTVVNKVTATKNLSSVREVTITAELADVLSNYIKQLDGADLFSPKHTAIKISNYMKKLCAKSGVDIQYISKRVGHKNVNVTLSTYAHMLKEKELAQDELALKILSKK